MLRHLKYLAEWWEVLPACNETAVNSQYRRREFTTSVSMFSFQQYKTKPVQMLNTCSCGWRTNFIHLHEKLYFFRNFFFLEIMHYLWTEYLPFNLSTSHVISLFLYSICGKVVKTQYVRRLPCTLRCIKGGCFLLLKHFHKSTYVFASGIFFPLPSIIQDVKKLKHDAEMPKLM